MTAILQCCCGEACWVVFTPCCGVFDPSERRYVACNVHDAIQWPGIEHVFKLEGVCWVKIPEIPPENVPRDLVVDASQLTDLYESCTGDFGSGACCKNECYYRATPCNCIGAPSSGDWAVKCQTMEDIGVGSGSTPTIKILRNGTQQCWEIDATTSYGEIPDGWGELLFTSYLGTATGCFECCTGNPTCCGCQGSAPPYCPPLPIYATIAWAVSDPGTDTGCPCLKPDAVLTLKINTAANCSFACQDNGGFGTNQGCLGPYACCLSCVPDNTPGCPPTMFWRLSITATSASTLDYDFFLQTGTFQCGDCQNPNWATGACTAVPCQNPEYLVVFRTPSLPACSCIPDPGSFYIESKSFNVSSAALVNLA